MNKTNVSVAEAKKHLSDLLGRVAYGKERIVISRRGKPMAVLVPSGEDLEGLAAVKGWLSNDDSFFEEISKIIKEREKEKARKVSPLEM